MMDTTLPVTEQVASQHDGVDGASSCASCAQLRERIKTLKAQVVKAKQSIVDTDKLMAMFKATDQECQQLKAQLKTAHTQLEQQQHEQSNGTHTSLKVVQLTAEADALRRDLEAQKQKTSEVVTECEKQSAKTRNAVEQLDQLQKNLQGEKALTKQLDAEVTQLRAFKTDKEKNQKLAAAKAAEAKEFKDQIDSLNAQLKAAEERAKTSTEQMKQAEARVDVQAARMQDQIAKLQEENKLLRDRSPSSSQNQIDAEVKSAQLRLKQAESENNSLRKQIAQLKEHEHPVSSAMARQNSAPKLSAAASPVSPQMSRLLERMRDRIDTLAREKIGLQKVIDDLHRHQIVPSTEGSADFTDELWDFGVQPSPLRQSGGGGSSSSSSPRLHGHYSSSFLTPESQPSKKRKAATTTALSLSSSAATTTTTPDWFEHDATVHKPQSPKRARKQPTAASSHAQPSSPPALSLSASAEMDQPKSPQRLRKRSQLSSDDDEGMDATRTSSSSSLVRAYSKTFEIAHDETLSPLSASEIIDFPDGLVLASEYLSTFQTFIKSAQAQPDEFKALIDQLVLGLRMRTEQCLKELFNASWDCFSASKPFYVPGHASSSGNDNNAEWIQTVVSTGALPQSFFDSVKWNDLVLIPGVHSSELRLWALVSTALSALQPEDAHHVRAAIADALKPSEDVHAVAGMWVWRLFLVDAFLAGDSDAVRIAVLGAIQDQHTPNLWLPILHNVALIWPSLLEWSRPSDRPVSVEAVLTVEFGEMLVYAMQAIISSMYKLLSESANQLHPQDQLYQALVERCHWQPLPGANDEQFACRVLSVHMADLLQRLSFKENSFEWTTESATFLAAFYLVLRYIDDFEWIYKHVAVDKLWAVIIAPVEVSDTLYAGAVFIFACIVSIGIDAAKVTPSLKEFVPSIVPPFFEGFDNPGTPRPPCQQVHWAFALLQMVESGDVAAGEAIVKAVLKWHAKLPNDIAKRLPASFVKLLDL